ncbi:hypothetical protein MMC13_008395 [Lambiella insularis]|nr:hypothetical protein [Lambiella insularis]
MFFDKDLQTGISLALEQSKVVVCFVTGTNDQTTLWQDNYLQDEEVCSLLMSNAVVLRIVDGSEEAGYLAAFHPVSSLPSIVVINNGKILADIHGNLTRETWKQSLKTAVNGKTQHDALTSAPGVTNNSNPEPQAQIFPPDQTSESDVRPNPAIQSLLEERRLRLEGDHKEKEASEKAERLAKQEAQCAKAENAFSDTSRAKQATYAQQQRRKQQEMRQERERILKVIDNDKLERKYKERLRKASSPTETRSDDGAGGLVDQQLSSETTQSTSRIPKDCAIQVRLFDCSTIRSRFPSDQNIRTDVRRWIDRRRKDGDAPYNFMQVLTPQPNREISISEEEESLQELGLAPSATLVMIPVHGYTAAYSTDAGYVGKGFSLGYNTCSRGVGWIAEAVGNLLGLGPEAAHPVQSARTIDTPIQGSTETSQSGTRIRTLKDQQEYSDSQHFYNGNQLNFEPRTEDDTKFEQL